ncbi:MAG: ABC transporter ATP-binding protein [Candidatus Tectomicrobia bacterium]|nr:ABC transporter ATP-binding protein [Candidatus Tectomicrobia bacterium]
MLKVSNLYAAYGEILALKGVSLEVREGETVTLIGSNGAGKSTLLKTISGVMRPRGGDIVFDGHHLNRMKPHEIVRQGIVQVQEGRAILKRLTVLENLEMGGYLRPRDTEYREDLQRIFERFPILDQRKQQLAGSLSGGEQQMLAIARGLMAKPRLIMMDEPSLGLAPLIVSEIFRIIAEMKKEGRTILLVEQNARKALQVSDRGYVIVTGNIILEDSCEALLGNSEVQEAYLGGRKA